MTSVVQHQTQQGRTLVFAYGVASYLAFLDAFLRGDVKRLVVVERLADPPPPQAAADWLFDKLKDIFRRS